MEKFIEYAALAVVLIFIAAVLSGCTTPQDSIWEILPTIEIGSFGGYP